MLTLAPGWKAGRFRSVRCSVTFSQLRRAEDTGVSWLGAMEDDNEKEEEQKEEEEEKKMTRKKEAKDDDREHLRW